MTNICRRREGKTGVHCQEPDGYDSFFSSLATFLSGEEKGLIFKGKQLLRTTDEPISKCPVMLGKATPQELYSVLMDNLNATPPDKTHT